MSLTNSLVFDTISANVDENSRNFKPIKKTDFLEKTAEAAAAAAAPATSENIKTNKNNKTTTTIKITSSTKTPNPTPTPTQLRQTTQATNPLLLETSLVGNCVAATSPNKSTTEVVKSTASPTGTTATATPSLTLELTNTSSNSSKESKSNVLMTGQISNKHDHSSSTSGAGGVPPNALKSTISTTSNISTFGGSCRGNSTFKILKTLGKGNFAKVKLALHVPTGREVAIKIIDKTQLNVSALQKLHREVGIMKLLNHPNIVKLYQVIETERTLYLVMEYASRGELFEHLVKNGRMKEREARVIFRQLVSAIQYCHSKFIVHRDLKAENLLLDHRNNIKIADFGFGNTFDPKSHLETFCGSPPYAAPELFMGKKYAGPEADAWSLGVILYTLVSGTLPFDGGTLKELRERVLRGKYRVPYYISMDCENLLRKFLVLTPEKRSSLTAVLNDKWLNSGYDQSNKLKPYRESSLLLNDPSRFDLIQEMGFQLKDIKSSMEEQRFDDIYCTYMLLGLPRSKLEESNSSTKVTTSSTSTNYTSTYQPTVVAPRLAIGLASQEKATNGTSNGGVGGSGSGVPPTKPTRRSVCRSPATPMTSTMSTVQSRVDSGLHAKHTSTSPLLPAAKRQNSVDVKPTLLSAQRSKLVAQQQKNQYSSSGYSNSGSTSCTSGSATATSSSTSTTPARVYRPTTVYEKSNDSPVTSLCDRPSKISMDANIMNRLKISTPQPRQESKKAKCSVASNDMPLGFVRNNARATFHFGQAHSSKMARGNNDIGYQDLASDDTKPASRIGFFSKLTARFGRRTMQLHEKDLMEQRKNLTK